MKAKRREFLRLSAAGLALGRWAGSPVLAAQQSSSDGIPTRPLGDTGERVAIVGLGGHHIGKLEEKKAVRLMHRAIDEGMTFFDNAWDYHMGRSEKFMGKALADGGRRDKVFLMTKCCARDYQGAMQNLHESLRRLQTEHLDLWQFHEINYAVDPDWLFEKGAIKAAIEAQRKGLVRFVGFTGHKDFSIHLRLLDKPFDWQTVQMPINILDASFRSFQDHVLPVCQERGIGAIGMKALAGGHLIRGAGLDPVLCRRYSLSLPISTMVCGIESEENLDQDLALARGFEPLGPEELKAFVDRTEPLAREGKHEPFKTTQQFDNAYHRGQHGV